MHACVMIHLDLPHSHLCLCWWTFGRRGAGHANSLRPSWTQLSRCVITHCIMVHACACKHHMLVPQAYGGTLKVVKVEADPNPNLVEKYQVRTQAQVISQVYSNGVHHNKLFYQ